MKSKACLLMNCQGNHAWHKLNVYLSNGMEHVQVHVIKLL